jgi:hypothetical protein
MHTDKCTLKKNILIEHINRNRGKKLIGVISILFPPRKKLKDQPVVASPTAAQSSGSGVNLASNANSLVKRLKLLIASKNAGHTGHDKEID